eukprot:TRINITY_DN66979_c8_g6_i2.p1 TRINITY_DN66979_c8_g6~~TRINITY_DN66979_c8_g6_i2.p1  ORF type:complete len:575 (-),score=61.95 TRINITY_DN66979_c8_g6_i2:906-2630(-)
MFSGLQFAFDSPLTCLKNKQRLSKLIKTNSGAVVPCVNAKTDFLICFDKIKGPQGSALLAAARFQTTVLHADFVDECLTRKKLVDAEQFRVLINNEALDTMIDDTAFCCPTCGWPGQDSRTATDKPRKPREDVGSSSCDGGGGDDSVGVVYGLQTEDESMVGHWESDGAHALPSSVWSFDEMCLEIALLRGIYSYGFEKPSYVQSRVIPGIVAGEDVVFQAQSGTGKTAAYTIGLLQRISPHAAEHNRKLTQQPPRSATADGQQQQQPCYGIVLLPSRELAEQVQQVMNGVGDFLFDGSWTHLCVGGTSVARDIKALKDCRVAIGSAGRIYDLIRRGALCTSTVEVLVLDEVDEWATQSKTESVYDIFKFLPKEVQFIGATAADIPELWKKVARNYKAITIPKNSQLVSSSTMKHYYVEVEEEYKLEALEDLFEELSVAGQAVVFVNSRKKAEWVKQKLNDADCLVNCMHADMAMAERHKQLVEFRSGAVKVLISTEDLMRGLDFPHVKVVVNFDLPTTLRGFLHRVGRCGRFGRRGLSLSFCTKRDLATIKEIESSYTTDINEFPMDALSWVA